MWDGDDAGLGAAGHRMALEWLTAGRCWLRIGSLCISVVYTRLKAVFMRLSRHSLPTLKVEPQLVPLNPNHDPLSSSILLPPPFVPRPDASGSGQATACSFARPQTAMRLRQCRAYKAKGGSLDLEKLKSDRSAKRALMGWGSHRSFSSPISFESCVAS